MDYCFATQYQKVFSGPNVLRTINIEWSYGTKKANITGKELTPSLLKYLVEKTNGKTLLSNIELIKNNAMLGAKVAKALDY